MFTEQMMTLEKNIQEMTATINTQRADLVKKLEENDVEGATQLKNDREANKAKLDQMKTELNAYTAALEGDVNFKSGASSQNSSKMSEYSMNLNEFIRSKGRHTEGIEMIGEEAVVPAGLFNSAVKMAIDPVTDGVKKSDAKSVSSEEISYVPERAIKTVVDLKQFTRIHPAKKGSGKYPILKRATSRMNSVAELEKNPKLAKPEFDDISWEVVTYRGAIPLSQESIDDADVDLMGIVSENIDEISLNTTNYAIAEVMKTFTPKTITGLDDIKKIYNVDLDPAYNKAFVSSQSFYNFLDTVKDGNGRYMLNDSIVSASGRVFGSYPIFPVGDDVLGAEGEAHSFLGDIRRAILFADRKRLSLRWVDHEIYGQYLQAVIRFDVKKADEKAGYFLTYTEPTNGGSGE